MKGLLSRTRFGLSRLGTVALAVIITLGVAGFGGPGSGAAAERNAPTITCPGTPAQCFTDVPPSNPFFNEVNNLFMNGIIGGFACGGPGEPCDAFNRPYYRPANNVTRQQMTKFIDLGRRNIANAVGLSLALTNTVAPALVISTTTTDGIRVGIAASADGVDTDCTRANQNCYALEASAVTGNHTGYFEGGKGMYTRSDDNTFPSINGRSTGATAYGAEFLSDDYVSLRVAAPPANNGFIMLRVEGFGGTITTQRILNGALDVQGNLIVTGFKSGYVVDAMQNAGTVALEPGDVVVIVGYSAPVLGEIPVALVQKAAEAYDTGVVGIMDQVLYVPDAATRAAYERQEADWAAALRERDRLMSNAQNEGGRPDPANVLIPPATITDEQGTVHALADVTRVAPNGYANVVTLGSYKAVKVDASYGAIQPGDLLTTSPNPGHAMKVTDKLAATGAIIGKAMGGLDNGTGTIPVMVTLK